MTDDQKIQQDRRIAQQSVAFDRRLDMNARVSVLEVQMNNNTQRIDDHADTTDKIIGRLDAHIQQSTARDQHLQQTIGQITTAVTVLSGTVSETNTTLKEIAKMASESHSEILKWNTIISTIAKLAAMGAIVIGAAWSVFTWVESNHHDKVALADIPAHVMQDATIKSDTQLP